MSKFLRISPKKLILFEVCEFFIYQTERKLKERYPQIPIEAVVGDIRDRGRVKNSINKYKPDLVFHAAAYKHVPMMEQNPGEAAKTNIGGTRILAEEAVEGKVGKFVMISSDKAVNPTNIMGASKRAAETRLSKAPLEGRNQIYYS